MVIWRVPVSACQSWSPFQPSYLSSSSSLSFAASGGKIIIASRRIAARLALLHKCQPMKSNIHMLHLQDIIICKMHRVENKFSLIIHQIHIQTLHKKWCLCTCHSQCLQGYRTTKLHTQYTSNTSICIHIHMLSVSTGRTGPHLSKKHLSQVWRFPC